MTIDILDDTRPLILPSKPYEGVLQGTATLVEGVWYIDYSGQLHNEGGPDLTIMQYQQRVHFDARLVSWDEWEEWQKEYLATLLTEPLPITGERYNDALEVLPPCRWHSCGAFSVFHVSERLDGNLVSWFGKSGDKYWEWINYANTPSEELNKQLMTASKNAHEKE